MAGKPRLSSDEVAKLPIKAQVNWLDFFNDGGKQWIKLKDPSRQMMINAISDDGEKLPYGTLETVVRDGERILVECDYQFVAYKIAEFLRPLGFLQDGKWNQKMFEAWFGENGIILEYESSEGKRQEQEKERKAARDYCFATGLDPDDETDFQFALKSLAEARAFREKRMNNDSDTPPETSNGKTRAKAGVK